MSYQALTDQYIMKTYNRFPVQFVKGEGCYLYDETNKAYLDFGSGIAVNCLGYGDKALEEAMIEQVKSLCHISNLYYSKPQLDVSKYLVDHSHFDKVFFCNSGAEANEAALKLARKYGRSIDENKTKVISMHQSFHGRTYGAMTLTGQTKYQKNFLPKLQNIDYVSYNDSHAIKECMDDSVCAVILEVIQGEGGIIVGDKDFLQTVQNLCEAHNALLIVDEVQTGIGRCGSLFAFEKFGITPNVVSVAKGLGGGVPIGAMLCDQKADVFVPGDHASTFGGNLLATTAATVVLERMTAPEMMAHVNEVGEYLAQKLIGLQGKYDIIKEVRGLGLMQGIELTVEQSPIIKKCLDKGLLLIGAGTHIIRFVPPLIITKELIDEGLSLLEEALQEIAKEGEIE